MVVADEDLPRKRSRLSLKSKKGDNTTISEESDPPSQETAGMTPQGLLLKSEEEATDCSPPVIDLTESDLPSEGPGVPPVASMENLGNTCFLNSVLEVLRYTPCFLEGLEELYRHIVYLEKVKASDIVQSSDEVKTDPSLAWDLVKNMFKMYKRMEKREEMFGQFANADVTSMAVKPDKVLDVIREFNPMFEGHMQHDAQEVLRCVLCYLEDSERELHSDYASILALHPALLKTPAPGSLAASSVTATVTATITSTSSSHDIDRVEGNPIMEKFLAAGKSKLRHGAKSSAITALKFQQPPSETQLSESGENNNGDNVHDWARFKRSNTSSSKYPDVSEVTVVGGCKEEVSPNLAPEAKKRRFRHTRLKRVLESEQFDEVDFMDKKEVNKSEAERMAETAQATASPDLAPSDPDVKREEGQVPHSESLVRRSVRQRVNNKRLADYVSQNKAGKGKRTCRAQSPPKTEGSDWKPLLYSEALKKPETPMERTVVNGDHHVEGPGGVDKSQPTIVSMFSKRGGGGVGQCRRLGMRGRIVHHVSPTSALLSPPRSPGSPPEQSPEPRRSPRKPNSSRPVAVTMSPRKQNGVITPSVSPARPDEFPSHAVSRSSAGSDDLDLAWLGGGRDRSPPAQKSPGSAQVWEVGDPSSSPTVTFPAVNYGGKAAAASSGLEQAAEDTDSTDADELHDLVPSSYGTEEGLDGLHMRQGGVTYPVKSRLEKMLALKKGKTSVAGVPSPVGPGSGVGGCPSSARDFGWNAQPSSKLMIKLEKCDHLCNTPTISASAALKALKGPTGLCRKMVFDDDNNDDDDRDVETNNEQDSDEDEVSLGTKSSFKSVPLKSVCVKVEKCDMVCDSPEKWVSARLATSTLARQRAQRFNMIEKLFQGTMVNRTKCLECERCTERKESFQDVSVPLTAQGSANSDSESDEEKDSSLLRLMRAFTDVEHLRDDNKYYCEQCYRYVEAERSLHYEALPNILTVHLKRFSATGMFGCLSKINDYVTVPLLLSCLRYKCPKPCVRPDHRYTLYAIITHAGSTISAGHYLSYIKVRPNALGHETLSPYLNTPAKQHDDAHDIFDSPSTPRRPADSETETVPHSTVTEKGDWSSDVHEDCNGELNNGMQTPPRGAGDGQPVSDDACPADYHWLECDDETIRILSEKEFEGRLLEKEGALRGTPYVLFYHRLDAWNAK